MQVCNVVPLLETSVTCHGGYATLSCGELFNLENFNYLELFHLFMLDLLNLHVENGGIQINTANYGRTDKVTCSEGHPSSELQNSNCYSPNALAPVSKR